MKTRTEILELTQEDLVDLFSTATYGSLWLAIHAQDREGVEINENDCREDIWAKCLLAGKSIICTDLNSEGEWNYGNLPSRVDDEGYVEYSVNLQNIKDGLSKCADGDFDYHGTENDFLSECFFNFRSNNGDFDNLQAECVMQVVIFGEIIYG